MNKRTLLSVLIAGACVAPFMAPILSGMIRVYGYNWEAVGAYNAGLKKENYPQRMKYAHKVWAKYQQLKLAARY